MLFALVVVLVLPFITPAVLAYARSQQTHARSGSLQATMSRIATVRAILVIGVVLIEGVVVFMRAAESFSDVDPMRVTPTVLAGLCVATIAVLSSAVLFVYGLRTALRIRRASVRVRTEGERADPPAQLQPSIDFGVGDAFWVFRHAHAAGYRETAARLEWARGTPPPEWAPLVVPVLDVLYGLCFALLCAASFATIAP